MYNDLTESSPAQLRQEIQEMALVRCEEVHLKRHDRERLKGLGYVDYIPAGHLPGIVHCGRKGCPHKGAIVLKEKERAILD